MMKRHEKWEYKAHEIEVRQGTELDADGWWCAIDGDDAGMSIEDTRKRAVEIATAIIDEIMA